MAMTQHTEDVMLISETEEQDTTHLNAMVTHMTNKD